MVFAQSAHNKVDTYHINAGPVTVAFTHMSANLSYYLIGKRGCAIGLGLLPDELVLCPT